MKNQDANCCVLQQGDSARDHAHVQKRTPQKTRIKQATPLSPMQKQTARARKGGLVRPL